ncbi:hypothetical protein EYF80_045046 [Liparis tanakae]|uniref:Uncharacterized protein n=1 Tax=Liparis tanakae TaxID=230148 RepID=A0A4Z2FU54_9TELE|nr:hypothetical protein EYF80_045046 [Liparis tanakae]
MSLSNSEPPAVLSNRVRDAPLSRFTWTISPSHRRAAGQPGRGSSERTESNGPPRSCTPALVLTGVESRSLIRSPA